MKAKVLISYYSQESGHQTHRVYLEKDYPQAEKDLKLISDADQLGKNWELSECELFGSSISLFESLRAAKALFDTQGINEKSRIGGEQYQKIINALTLQSL